MLKLVNSKMHTPKSRGFLKNSSSFDFDALNVALNDARLIDLCTHKLQSTVITIHKYHNFSPKYIHITAHNALTFGYLRQRQLD